MDFMLDCVIIFFKLEDLIFIEYLRFEIVFVELEFKESNCLFCYMYYVKIYLIVYVYYMRYKYCIYKCRFIDVYRVY